MPKRAKLDIDSIVHFNDVSFQVFRDTETGVDELDRHVMDVEDITSVHTTKHQILEALTRDPDTPYAFFTKRHFKADPFPQVFVGGNPVHPMDIRIFPDDKTIEIHNGMLGLGDGVTVHANYDYDVIEVLDDYEIESGKTYYGPPATALRIPVEIKIIYNEIENRIEITFSIDNRGVTYFYKIKAFDKDGNKSEFSTEKFVELKDNDSYIRIERSKDRKKWEEIAFGTTNKWFTEVLTVDYPSGLENIHITPLNSKEAKIAFDNPWKTYLNDPRTTYVYRIRAEDSNGEVTDWFEFSLPPIFIMPKEILIRRKVDNGTYSTKTETDAIDVFRLHLEDIDLTADRLEFIDTQLNEVAVYGYTFFYTDRTDKDSLIPAYAISDHLIWSNIFLFKKQVKYEKPAGRDFFTTFELADHIIEIGVKEEL